MPEPIVDEETATRTNSLCLFQVQGISFLNRCSNCPGAARTALNHRRCPLDASQPNIFRPVDPESQIKSSASSSKLHEADTLHAKAARLSLTDSSEPARTFGRSKSDSEICGNKTELSVPAPVPHVDGVLKRKAQPEADREAKREAKHRKKVLSDEFRHLSIPEWMETKPQNPFHDSAVGNLYMPGSRLVSTNYLASFSAANPMDLHEDHPLGEASYPRLFIPGCIMDTELDGCGVLACDDGVEANGCMLIDELSL